MAVKSTDAAPAGDKSNPPQAAVPGVLGIAAALDTSGPAEVPPATEFSPSGAPRQVTEIDVAHPAVDNDPRAGTTDHMNRIDFNDPTKTGAEVAAEGAEPEKSKAKA